MKKIFLFTVFLLVSGFTNTTYAKSKFKLLTDVGKVPPTIGRCHMGSCTWGRTISVRIVQQSEEQAILEVTLLGGESIHDNPEDYPNSYNKSIPIEWDKETHKIVVTCSYEHPSVAVDNQITALALGFTDPEIFTSDVVTYFQYCHSYYEGTKGYDDYDGSEKFGYHPIEQTTR
jgi:hypothetical protein